MNTSKSLIVLRLILQYSTLNTFIDITVSMRLSQFSNEQHICQSKHYQKLLQTYYIKRSTHLFTKEHLNRNQINITLTNEQSNDK